jgi:tetratricopeptide (TPR) repeat protein
MGLFYEADFLVRSGFDYPRLWLHEPQFLRGGPAVYLASLLPTFIALLTKALGEPERVFLAYRLFTMGCAAAVLLGVFAWVRLRAGGFAAGLVAAALATTPPFAVQMELLGMETPLAAATLLVAWLACRERFVRAAAAAVGAFLLKPSGLLVAAALVAYIAASTALLWRGRNARWRRDRRRGLAAAGATLALLLAAVRRLQRLPNHDEVAGFFDLNRGLRLLADSARWCPDVAALFLLSAVVSAAWIVARARRPESRGPLAAMRALAVEEPVVLFAWILLLGSLAGYSYTYVLPRYFVLVLTLLALVLGRLGFVAPRGRPVGALAAALLAALNLWNADGRLYPAIADSRASDRRTGAILERSREYLADHRANILACAVLAENPDRIVIAPNPFVHFLSMSSLGYVRAPLRGYALNEVVNEHFRPIDEFRRFRGGEVVFVAVRNRFTDQASAAVPEFDPRTDALLYSDGAPDPLIVFSPRSQAGGDASDRREAMLRLWPWLAAVEQAQEQSRRGDFEDAIATLRAALPAPPRDAEVRFELGRVCEQAGRFQEAVEWYQSVPMARVWRARAMDRLAAMLEQAGRREEQLEAKKEAQRARWHFREPPGESR